MKEFRSAYLDWPAEISIETFAKCNASCTFCPYTTLDRIGTRMPDEMMDRVVEELKDHPGAFVIAPFKVNEPLLDKRLLPFCRRINEELPNAYLRLFTNGSALTIDHIEEIAALERVVHLWVSLNDTDKTRYHELMGLDFDRTSNNLDALHAAVVAGVFPHDVVVSKVRDIENDDEFCDYVKRRWPRFHVHLIKRDAWIDYTSPEIAEIPDTHCRRWFELSITATGKVAMCCMDGAGEYAIGDLREESLFEVYNKRFWRERRLLLMSRKQASGPCDRCSY